MLSKQDNLFSFHHFLIFFFKHGTVHVMLAKCLWGKKNQILIEKQNLQTPAQEREGGNCRRRKFISK